MFSQCPISCASEVLSPVLFQLSLFPIHKIFHLLVMYIPEVTYRFVHEHMPHDNDHNIITDWESQLHHIFPSSQPVMRVQLITCTIFYSNLGVGAVETMVPGVEFPSEEIHTYCQEWEVIPELCGTCWNHYYIMLHNTEKSERYDILKKKKVWKVCAEGLCWRSASWRASSLNRKQNWNMSLC